ncbi:hypothetical protein FACS1894193_08590 [Bacilli bacterium]|nr:hypothetical protein FACS1894192_00240 [Bacilli bacterium]GHU42744.1 hypothetical protein FACS1894193_08590 [Bacilli bacterium]GHU46764.1 hypothetical protein FACS1894194_4510 [Bacilli bacterium]
MEKIQLAQHKKLRLVNVLAKELRGVSLDDLNDKIQKFINFLEVSKIQTKGPLITKTIGTNVSDSGDISLDYDLYVQTVREINLQGYVFHPEIIVSNCLYAHFDGSQEDFKYVDDKMSLYIWENNLIACGEQYTIYLEEGGASLVADVFKPLERIDETL